MFQAKTTVPRITAAHVTLMETIAPGVTRISSIPVIETKEQALAVAKAQVEKNLLRYEYISQTSNIVETAAGWEIEFRIAGD